MKKRFCDKCKELIPDDNTKKGSAYNFHLHLDSDYFFDSLVLKKVDYCYNCALKMKKIIEDI